MLLVHFCRDLAFVEGVRNPACKTFNLAFVSLVLLGFALTFLLLASFPLFFPFLFSLDNIDLARLSWSLSLHYVNSSFLPLSTLALLLLCSP